MKIVHLNSLCRCQSSHCFTNTAIVRDIDTILQAYRQKSIGTAFTWKLYRQNRQTCNVISCRKYRNLNRNGNLENVLKGLFYNNLILKSKRLSAPRHNVGTIQSTWMTHLKGQTYRINCGASDKAGTSGKSKFLHLVWCVSRHPPSSFLRQVQWKTASRADENGISVRERAKFRAAIDSWSLQPQQSHNRTLKYTANLFHAFSVMKIKINGIR